MDHDTRNLIQRATLDARRLLEREYRDQLEGTFDIMPHTGVIAEKPGAHLDSRQQFVRTKIVTAILHKRAKCASHVEAVQAYLREAAFTMLNRFAALKMMEARKIVLECVSHGEQSSGFREFSGLALGLTALPDHGYRLYLECLFDEIGTELGVLFDRQDPASLLWLRRQALTDLLEVLNRSELTAANIWAEDETIGWIYQYFNDEAERRKMREESAAPRNSRELAVRNQFFTPRYVVQFLSDNTLGRIWLEMTQGETRLKEQCRYLVRRPHEIFLKPDETAPEQAETENLSQEDLLKAPVYIAHRPLKDPRAILMIDPACGSMHFGLYAFDLFEIIYEEAWNRPELHQQLAEAYGYAAPGEVVAVPESVRLRSGASVKCFFSGRQIPVEEALVVLARYAEGHIAGRPLIYHSAEVAARHTLLSLVIPLRQFNFAQAIKSNWFSPLTGLAFLGTAACFEFQTQKAKTKEEAYAAYQRDIPRLIIEHNIHGIDIDPRCAQIAGLSLWLRAQKAWQRLGVKPADRPTIKRSNIVCAEPMPGEKELLLEFVEREFPLEERGFFLRLLEITFNKMQLAGEAGSLLKIEEEIRSVIAEAKKLWKKGPKFEQALLFGDAVSAQGQTEMRLDLSGITDEQFWERAEERVYEKLHDYAEQAESGGGFQRRLFAEDAARGFAFIDVCRKRYDVALMNPPFGEAAIGAKEYINKTFPNTKNDVYAAFVEGCIDRQNRRARIGAITSRTGLFLTSFRRWREHVLLQQSSPVLLADFGKDVLDGAMVETAAYILEVQ